MRCLEGGFLKHDGRGLLIELEMSHEDHEGERDLQTVASAGMMLLLSLLLLLMMMMVWYEHMKESLEGIVD